MSGAASSRTFAHPSLVRSLSMFGILVCAALAAWLVFALKQSSGASSVLVAFSLICVAVFLYVGVAVARRSRDLIVVSEEGLCRRSPKQPSVLIAWNEIGAVETQNVMQRLVVTDRSGTRRIELEYHLENFGDLRRIVLERSGIAAHEPHLPGAIEGLAEHVRGKNARGH